ncbi:retropepsin-like aspartic protease family protein [Elongatibacter sediminis]|uniref:TIGR02281 family clan AA aspartic protease n=1 Tax=Elongatibacter sediminis TaxID=3119006 RepID=A0AAW9R9I2_9GAMM
MTGAGDAPSAGQGRRLYWAAIVAILLGLTALYHAVIRGQGGMSLSEDEHGRVLVVLERRRDSHFSADGQINGHDVHFLVDTGATDVAVSERLARSIGLEFGPRIGIMTAAGPVGGWVTRLDRVQFGVFTLRDVRATITPGLGEQALLGMSFLKHFSIVQEGDTLVIAAPGS